MMRKLILTIITAVGCLTAAAGPAVESVDSLQLEYKLHGQTRRFLCSFVKETDGGVTLSWEIMRNLKLWKGSYRMTPEAVGEGRSMSFLMPEDGKHVTLADGETFAMISRKALKELKERGRFDYDGTEYVLMGSDRSSPLGPLLHAVDRVEGAEIWVVDNQSFPIVWEMQENPLEINWRARKLN